MASDHTIATRHLLASESIVFIQRGGAMTAAVDPRTGQSFSIDEFGTSKGWLAATSGERVVHGYFGVLGGAKVRECVLVYKLASGPPAVLAS